MKKRLFKTALFFMSVTALMCIMIFSASAKTVNYGDFVFDVKTSSATLLEYKGKAADVTIPSKVSGVYVTEIGNEAFWCVKTMKTLSIPSTVTKIGTAAFNECTSLTKVVIPGKVKSIGESAFWYCTGLKTIVLPQSVTAIGKNAFKGCSAATVYVIAGSYGEKYVKLQSGIKLGYRYMSTLTLNKSAITVGVGAYDKLSCTVTPATVYYKKVTYTSSNPKVVAVSAYGTVKGMSCGTAVITVKTADGSNLVKKCTVKVVPDKVTTLSQSATTQTGYTLSWKAVAGATQYKLYKYNATTKKWDSFLITDKLSCKVSSLSASTVQYYRIMAFTKLGNVNYCSAVSSTFKAATAAIERPDNTTGLSAKPAHNFINLSWSAAKGATGYRVYSYNYTTKTYTLLTVTSKLAFKVANLEPATKYAFAVRTYAEKNNKIVYSSAASEIVYCTTRPDYVTGLEVKEGSLTHNSLTLKWNTVEKASGYYVSVYNEETKAFDKLAEIEAETFPTLAVNDLASDKEYTFTVRAYITTDSGKLYGYNSDSLKATTGTKPISNTEAFAGFIEAYNNTKNSTDNLIVFSEKYYKQSSINAPGSENYTSVLNAIFNEKSNDYFFTNGTENSTGKPLTAFVTPFNTSSALTYELIDQQSLTFEEDGSGYRITFALKSEDKNAAVNSLIAPTVDWNSVALENEDFTLGSCSYEGTIIEAKVKNGKIDDITFTTPLDISFCIDDTPYSFTGTTVTEYVFTWL